ncbi:N-acetylmuramoyl-L-alanine amidase family protein [Zobellia galactanivorans]|uniref:N-acetylmuramoyl-L-alanine amidase n=1 Tax=Zobellia galactanivorans (strain DSM 12802 / CCUG 47099 / CIP 106680 / NCIMB 13871 / Dsij) TaxID=63186 RepID=G0L1S7_ZOBGA|nr:N-acetylmuramoyl-L-alanine amidase [Zobellia galactanivorans]CAZ97878.1 N-acetylmuramoyl-L-alanine amidase [Zobellia galactanivorans]
MKASKYRVNTRVQRFFLFPIIFLALILSSFYTKNPENRNDGKFTVVLDAGHGGHDPGNMGNGYLEKQIALNIVLKAGSILEKNPNIKVIYTRKDDTFVDLYERGQIANKANADLFVSVHCDSHTSNAHGAGTFVLGLHANKQNFEIAKKENSVIYLEDNYKSKYADYDINSPESVIGLTIMQEEFLDQSIALAKAIQDNFTKKLKRTDRKVKQAGFIVLHQTVMPSVLVETGFLTNKEEGAYLNSKRGQSEMGTSIAEAILTYKENIRANIADFDTSIIASTPEPEPIEEKKEQPKPEPVAAPKKETVSQKIKDEPIVAKTTEVPAEPKKEAIQIIEEAKGNDQDVAVKKETPPEPQKTAPSVSKETTVAPAEKKSDVVYKVQIMASAKNLPLRPESFNGLNRVAKEPYKGLYRYVYGSTPSLEEAKMLKSNADLKGYTTSYIVAYRNGERIPFKDSLK